MLAYFSHLCRLSLLSEDTYLLELLSSAENTCWPMWFVIYKFQTWIELQSLRSSTVFDVAWWTCGLWKLLPYIFWHFCVNDDWAIPTYQSVDTDYQLIMDASLVMITHLLEVLFFVCFYPDFWMLMTDVLECWGLWFCNNQVMFTLTP